MKWNDITRVLFLCALLVTGWMVISQLTLPNECRMSDDERSDHLPKSSTDADIQIESISNANPCCSEVLNFHVVANNEDAKDHVIPMRLYVDADLNGDGTAHDDAIGELRYLYYGEGDISFKIPCNSFYEPGLRTFTVEIESSSPFSGSDDVQVTIIECPSITINSPGQESLYGSTPPNVSVEFSAKDIQSKMYKVHNHSEEGTYIEWAGEIRQEHWNLVGNGSVSVSFQLKDAYKHTVVKTLQGYEYPQASACFIQSVDDTMEDIMRLARSEASHWIRNRPENSN